MFKKKDDLLWWLAALWSFAIVILVVAGSVLFTEIPEPVIVTVEPIPEPPVPDLCLDVNTLCEQADQFGYQYISTLYFEDGNAVVVSESSTQVDNNTNRGHVVAFFSNHYVDSWFDIKNHATYSTFGDGYENESDWFCVVAGEDGDPLSLHLKDIIDYRSSVNKLQGLVDTCIASSQETKERTEQGIWYLVDLDTNAISSTTGLTPNKTTARIFVPKDDSLVTQVDFILEFDKNRFGVTSEVFEHEIEITDEFDCDVPVVVTEELADYPTQLALYNNLMR